MSTAPPAPPRLRVGWALRSVLGRLLWPPHWARLWRLRRQRAERVDADVQLRLYAGVLPAGFLHFGYFDDPDTPGEAVSLLSLQQAQARHAELVLEQVVDHTRPVLDVGAGTGGLARMLHERGFSVVAMTPDRYQIQQLRATLPAGVELVHARFEGFDVGAWAGRFGTVINSESLQYLRRSEVVPRVERLLGPGGRWVVCDYLRRERGHPWSFTWGELDEAVAGKLAVELDRDLTPHMLPTLRYGWMFGSRVATPLLDFLVEKLRTREPAAAWVLEEVLGRAQANLAWTLRGSDPEVFVREKAYRLRVMRR